MTSDGDPISSINYVSYINGLKFEHYPDGYFGDNVNWFISKTPQDTGYTSMGYNIHYLSNNIIKGNMNYDLRQTYSFEWTGYFRASVSGTYTFSTGSDDASYLWIGDNATTGYTTSNSIVSNGGLHGMRYREGQITLEKNSYYPIRIQFGEKSGGDNMVVRFKVPDNSEWIYNGNGYYYSIL